MSAPARDLDRPEDWLRPGATNYVDMRSLEKAITPPIILRPADRISEIADAIAGLTYGQMIALAEGLWSSRGQSEITCESLPAIIHRWSNAQTTRL